MRNRNNGLAGASRNSAGVSRRQFLQGAAALAALTPWGAQAQGLSSRPVRLIVPFTAGAGPDIVARLLAPKLQAKWNQPFVVENRPGASGTIGSDAVAKATPDGHTMLVGPASIVSVPHLYPKIPYDVTKSLAPVVAIGSTSMALVVHHAVPVNSVQEFIAYAKARPGTLNYGSPGSGTHHHLCMELFKQQTGIDVVHVPYKGSSGATNDLIAGHIPTMFVPVHIALPMLKGGQIKLLGVTFRDRHPLFKEFPTLHEQGITGYDVDLWLGLWTTAGVSAEIILKYNAAVRELIAQPDMAQALANQGLIATPGTPEAFGKLVVEDYERWGRVIRAANIKAD